MIRPWPDLAFIRPATAEEIRAAAVFAASKPRVIAEIRGGALVALYSSAPLNASVLDHDNDECLSEEDEAAFKALEAEIKTLPENPV